MLLVIISGACVSAVDDNSTSVGAADSSTQGVEGDSSSSDSSDDGEGSTGDEEIDVDVTVDEGNDDESGDVLSNDTDDSTVTVSLTDHATGIPIAMLIAFCLLPILRRK